MPYLVKARFFLAMLAGGSCLIAFNAYAQSSGAGRASRFRNQSNQQGTEPFAFYGFGPPLAGIATHPADQANFNNDLLNFQEGETLNAASVPSGPPGQLGPLFNNTSCAACQSNPARSSGGLELVEQWLSTGGPPIWELAVDHMLFGGRLSQGDHGFIYRFVQTAPPFGAEIGILDNTPSACQYVEYAQDFSQDLIGFPNILLCRALPVGAQNSIPPDLRMLLNLDLFRPQLQLDKPRQEDSSPDTSMLDQIRTLNALGYLDSDTYMNAGAKAAASEDEQPPAPASSGASRMRKPLLLTLDRISFSWRTRCSPTPKSTRWSLCYEVRARRSRNPSRSLPVYRIHGTTSFWPAPKPRVSMSW